MHEGKVVEAVLLEPMKVLDRVDKQHGSGLMILEDQKLVMPCLFQPNRSCLVFIVAQFLQAGSAGGTLTHEVSMGRGPDPRAVD
ncbi:hypothetical protein BCR44DRAFT_1432258, partial [Catenaria anguillulae PL171]